MFPADRKTKPVIVEYDCYNRRWAKQFENHWEAKQFFVSKQRAGKQPHIRSTTMATTTKAASANESTKKTGKKVAKKTVKKKTSKKAAAKKTTKKKTTKKRDLRDPSDGPTKSQLKILKALKGTKSGSKELDRVQLKKATSINGGWAKLLGAATREELGVQGGGLAGMGLITINRYEEDRKLKYSITAKGQKVLAKSA